MTKVKAARFGLIFLIVLMVLTFMVGNHLLASISAAPAARLPERGHLPLSQPIEPSLGASLTMALAQTSTVTATTSITTGVIILNPFAGSSASPVTLYGRGWQPGEIVVIYLLDEGQEYAIASTMTDTEGEFTVSFFIPRRLADQAVVPVVAQTLTGQEAARAFYTILDASPGPGLAPAPGSPQAVVTVGLLNVRSGPGVVYSILGQVERGQTLEITGANGGWWQIRFLHPQGEIGWVAGNFVTAENTENVPFVSAPPTPIPTSTPVPTPTPVPPPPAAAPQPATQCNPGQWSGCSPSFCPVEYVSQCQADGTWGQCVWDPGSCSTYTDDDDDDDDKDNNDNDNDDDNDNNDNDNDNDDDDNDN